MSELILACALAMASPAPAQQSRPPGLAPLAADRAELVALFGDPGGLGVIQVAAAGTAAETSLPLYPRYAGFESRLGLSAPAPEESLERLAAAAGSPAAIEAPADLRDALAAVPNAAPPRATQLPPSSWPKTGHERRAAAGAAPAVGPAGWLVVTREGGREVRPLATRADVARWTAAAELQRRAYEGILADRFSKNLGRLGTASKKAQ